MDAVVDGQAGLRPVLTVAGVLTWLATAAAGLLLLAATAEAARAPTPGELRAIRKATMRDCKTDQHAWRNHSCKWEGHVRVSTINPHYAWADASGPWYDNSGVLRRPSVKGQRWRSVWVWGGSAQSCAQIRRQVPRRVVHEFGVVAVSSEDWSTLVRC
ncbi:MAG TPA: hypothetical protein VHA54_07865 [Solirubrobacterales bacterium]|nr:hypothetical protein [Solirubrobacterales bacterium]